MSDSFSEYDRFIFNEMMIHPALFTHVGAKKIAIIGNDDEGLLSEATKHPELEDIANILTTNLSEWLPTVTESSLDVVIISDAVPVTSYQPYFNALTNHGILLHQNASLFQPARLRATYQAIEKTGFRDLQLLHFPQPSYPSGSLAAVMAVKTGTFRRVREKDIFNKPFSTRYYNFDVHKAACVMPEFIREELTA